MNRLRSRAWEFLLIAVLLAAGALAFYWKPSHAPDSEDDSPAATESMDEDGEDPGDEPETDGTMPDEKPAADEESSVRRPNVLLISIDTLRADHLSCLGYARPTTPNLDRLADANILFKNCRSQAPWTLPSHMSLFTSMLPSDNGVDNINKVLPPGINTLAEALRDEGYTTAALVNNGQMREHWGFNRGFETWREFDADLPDSDCEHITGAALDWLKKAPSAAAARPFFLFLHYYDVHDPYESPEPYHSQFGVTLDGLAARNLASSHRNPSEPFGNPEQLASLVTAYDAQIPWVDHELSRVLASVPRNTLIVLFADHGEAFKEHGWTLHGATLYDEEVHVPLVIRLPESRKKHAVVGESVMLLDVAPTILSACGIRAPAQFQGTDLTPLWEGKTAPPRLVPAESKAVLEGRFTRSLVLYPLKAVYSLFDGRFELYKLPDERRDIANTDSAAADALFRPLRRWMDTERYWMLQAAGSGDFEAELTLAEGQFALFIPVGFDLDRDRFEPSPDDKKLAWHVYPGGAGKVKSLLIETDPPEAAITADFKINGTRSEKTVFLGPGQAHPQALPVQLDTQLGAVSPVIEKPFAAAHDGFYISRHASGDAQPRSRASKVEPPDEQTIKQLKSLGYLQ